jgi:hypothetical protein
MRPPICAICHKRFKTSDGGLVHFKETEEDKVFNLKFKTTRMVGHKRALEWFCGEHIAVARKHKHLIWREAKPLIKEGS